MISIALATKVSASSSRLGLLVDIAVEYSVHGGLAATMSKYPNGYADL